MYAGLDAIDAIVQLVNPPKEKKISLHNFLSALTAGLAFIPLPGLSTVALGIGNSAVLALQQAPGVAKAIWPTETADVRSRVLESLSITLTNSRVASFK